VGVSFNARRIARVAAVLTIVVAGALAVRASGVVDLAGDEDRLRSTVDDAGLLGPLLFLGLMVLLVPLNVPGVAFVVPSTALFGTPGGIALSLAGGYVASMVGVVAARRLGRSAFEARMPDRVRRWEARLSSRGFWGLVAVRSCTYLMQPVDWLCGVSSIPMRTVASATLVGLVPPTLVVALGGGRLLEGVL
jgi:uncharacterized membrane protein YdjX (TVP38/TMEM64 family)